MTLGRPVGAKLKKKKLHALGQVDQGISGSKKIVLGGDRVAVRGGGGIEGNFDGGWSGEREKRGDREVYLTKRAGLEQSSSSDGGEGVGAGSKKRKFPVTCKDEMGKREEPENMNGVKQVGDS